VTVKIRCIKCGQVFECNGDKVCPDIFKCYCKECTIKDSLDKSKASINECYDVKEKVEFT
jgi:hypothetical protein